MKNSIESQNGNDLHVLPSAAAETIIDQTKSARGVLERVAVSISTWSEKWYPDSFVFAALAVVVVSAGALLIGASKQSIAQSFGDGFWTLIPFTMQIAISCIMGYVVASSPPADRLIHKVALMPKTGRGAVAFVALISMVVSLFSWAMSLVFSGLLVRALARRNNFAMDYRAASAAAYLGLGATWALGLSSAAAQLQSNPGSIPQQILAITGIIPFTETIFLWQSMLMASVLIVTSIAIAYFSAPSDSRAKTAKMLGVGIEKYSDLLPPRERPGEWLEYSPLITVAIVALGFGWLVNELGNKNPILAISNLNTYNLLFMMLGLLLCWRPKCFLMAVSKSVPAIGGILIQFPLYGSIAAIMTSVKDPQGMSLAHHLASIFVSLASKDTYPVVMGIYSAVLGFFLPSGGGKWVVEAPYVMQAANDLHVHLGWAVQTYNAAEALPNLINPFWMLPLLGIVGLKARELIGFTFTQFIFHVPLIMFMLWILAPTLPYHAPVLH